MNQISRFKHIDSLRGIAVLFVIWLHVSEIYVNLSSSVKEKGTFLYDFACGGCQGSCHLNLNYIASLNCCC